jgi:hypothetical protein
MINYASRCLKLTLKVLKFSEPEQKFPKKLKLRGGISPLESFKRLFKKKITGAIDHAPQIILRAFTALA